MCGVVGPVLDYLSPSRRTDQTRQDGPEQEQDRTDWTGRKWTGLETELERERNLEGELQFEFARFKLKFQSKIRV